MATLQTARPDIPTTVPASSMPVAGIPRSSSPPASNRQRQQDGLLDAQPSGQPRRRRPRHRKTERGDGRDDCRHQRPVAQHLLKIVQQRRRAGDPGPKVQSDQHQRNNAERRRRCAAWAVRRSARGSGRGSSHLFKLDVRRLMSRVLWQTSPGCSRGGHRLGPRQGPRAGRSTRKDGWPWLRRKLRPKRSTTSAQDAEVPASPSSPGWHGWGSPDVDTWRRCTSTRTPCARLPRHHPPPPHRRSRRRLAPEAAAGIRTECRRQESAG